MHYTPGSPGLFPANRVQHLLMSIPVMDSAMGLPSSWANLICSQQKACRCLSRVTIPVKNEADLQ